MTDYTQWLKDNFCENAFFLQDQVTLETINGLLKYHKLYETFIYLKFKTNSIVLCLDSEDADKDILKHYGNSLIFSYDSLSSKNNFDNYPKKLKICNVSFIEEKTEFTSRENVAPLIKKAEEDDHLQFELEKTGEEWTLLFAWKNVDIKNFMYRVASICFNAKMKINAAKFTVKDFVTTKTIFVGKLRMFGENFETEAKRVEFIEEFSCLKDCLEADPITQLVDDHVFSNASAFLLRAYCTMAEQFLSDKDASLYSLDNIYDAMTFHVDITKLILESFLMKFDPKKGDEYKGKLEEVKKAIEHIDTGRKRHDDRRKNIFRFVIVLIECTLKTNYYIKNTLSLGFRMNPEFMDKVPGFDRKSKYPELPYAIFFNYGTSHFGFHVRFRDLARGGLRTVITRDAEQAKYEKINMFGECYNLSYTQQKKNKDIPEGGAKQIIYLPPNKVQEEGKIVAEALKFEGKSDVEVEAQRVKYCKDMSLEYMYERQRSFVITLLSLIVTKDGKLNPNIKDYYGIPEFIYLGPDENMHDCMIEWIAKESTQEGYHVKGAFISGKEETGINHKEYGVTSLGVFQYLKQGLEHIGLGEKPYTIKMSGGADGDVGGNLIRLLNKHHSDRAKLLAITDKSGTIYDPEGLDLKTLDSFFYSVKPIGDYPPEKLHDGGFLLMIGTSREVTAYHKETLLYKKVNGKVEETWIAASEAVHLFATNVHQVEADVFCPCGGRPRALNEDNVDTYFKNGKPTSKLIVEGANLYLTPGSRTVLEKAGVMIFKDSSANKCGVISSSYEILAGLSLDDQQFVAIKKDYAKDLLVRLEKVANEEAVCMLKFNKKTDMPLTQVSDLVSLKINEYTDAFATYFLKLDLFAPENQKLLQIFKDYVPKVLAERHMEQVMKRVPQMHMKAIIATSLACKLVYGRGLDWNVTVVDVLPIFLNEL
ncbi:glutamate dehydrogenase, putative [Entamoeba invadens IP1]|uniref:glutamate dehydrogenase, putative n=1 Tax=Entamoeba invadens IP1 TaxID=370355 RepID=UPI0002C3D65D|nr:glutamate dehydrogenase, putative [Entamoeba invadens IP1]ELP93998.1 glutamate dehydrogenase, putative [Entamoeba invadens IP1]|eukprot:XP_004260769.1 glutamate dehydrogenase, putative [Entamoeba invadens IP1]